MPLSPSSRAGAVVIGGANIDVKARSLGRRCRPPATPAPSLAARRRGRPQRRREPRPARHPHLTWSPPSARDRLGDQVLAAHRGGRRDVDARRRTDRGHRHLHRRARRRRRAGRRGRRHGRHRRRSARRRRRRARPGRRGRRWSCSTATSPPPTLGGALDLAPAAGVRVVLDPVSVPKAAALAALLTDGRPLLAVTPNRDELAALTGLPDADDRRSDAAAAPARPRRRAGLGAARRGRLAAQRPRRRHSLRAPCPPEVADVTGAGDAMLAAFCHALLGGRTPADAPRRTATPPPRSPSPARTPSAPT